MDTTVQPKAVTFPTDAQLLNRGRDRLVRMAAWLKSSARACANPMRVEQVGFDQAPAPRPCSSIQERQPELQLKTYLGRLIRDIELEQERSQVESTIFRTFDQATASVCTTCG
jgi:transposase, IS5 family